MEKKKHLQTKFIQFLWERYNDTSEPEDEYDIETPLPEEEREYLLHLKKDKPLKSVEIQEEEDELEEEPVEDEGEDEDKVIERLLHQYKKLKREYESNKIRNRRRNTL